MQATELVRNSIRPHTRQMTQYVARRYEVYEFGVYKRARKTIAYNHPSEDEAKKGNHRRWVENVSDGLRFVGEAHEIASLRNTGYYCDSFQDEVAKGGVWQLPGHDGNPLFVAGVIDPCRADCAWIDFDTTTEKRDAAYWADSMAERYAEDEREYQAKSRAEERIEEIGEEIQSAMAEFKALACEIRANCKQLGKMAEVRKLIRRELARVRRETRGLRRERAKLRDNFWCVFGNY